MHVTLLAVAAGLGLVLAPLNRMRVTVLWPYLVIGVGLWVAVHESGPHATLAGVVLAFTIPTRTRVDARAFVHEARGHLEAFARTETGDGLVLTSPGQQEALHAIDAASRAVNAPLLRLEHALHGPGAFLLMPNFAIANAGVPVGGSDAPAGVAFAVAVGLRVGKPLGIVAASWLACRIGVASRPAGVSWAMLHGCGWVAGTGFTMSLFIAGLAFGATPACQAAQTGILAGSAVAAAIGAWLVRRAVATA